MKCNFVVTLLPGDANLDLVVNSADYAIWSSHYGPNGLFTLGDFDGSGNVDTTDIMFWYANQSTNLTTVSVAGDLNGDWKVDELDRDILFSNWLNGLQNPTHADGDIDGDGDIDTSDLDLLFAQYGLALDVVS